MRVPTLQSSLADLLRRKASFLSDWEQLLVMFRRCLPPRPGALQAVGYQELRITEGAVLAFHSEPRLLRSFERRGDLKSEIALSSAAKVQKPAVWSLG